MTFVALLFLLWQVAVFLLLEFHLAVAWLKPFCYIFQIFREK
jgi:hypothetical protein